MSSRRNKNRLEPSPRIELAYGDYSDEFSEGDSPRSPRSRRRNETYSSGYEDEPPQAELAEQSSTTHPQQQEEDTYEARTMDPPSQPNRKAQHFVDRRHQAPRRPDTDQQRSRDTESGRRRRYQLRSDRGRKGGDGYPDTNSRTVASAQPKRAFHRGDSPPIQDWKRPRRGVSGPAAPSPTVLSTSRSSGCSSLKDVLDTIDGLQELLELKLREVRAGDEDMAEFLDEIISGLKPCQRRLASEVATSAQEIPPSQRSRTFPTEYDRRPRPLAQPPGLTIPIEPQRQPPSFPTQITPVQPHQILPSQLISPRLSISNTTEQRSVTTETPDRYPRPPINTSMTSQPPMAPMIPSSMVEWVPTIPGMGCDICQSLASDCLVPQGSFDSTEFVYTGAVPGKDGHPERKNCQNCTRNQSDCTWTETDLMRTSIVETIPHQNMDDDDFDWEGLRQEFM